MKKCASSRWSLARLDQVIVDLGPGLTHGRIPDWPLLGARRRSEGQVPFRQQSLHRAEVREACRIIGVAVPTTPGDEVHGLRPGLDHQLVQANRRIATARPVHLCLRKPRDLTLVLKNHPLPLGPLGHQLLVPRRGRVRCTREVLRKAQPTGRKPTRRRELPCALEHGRDSRRKVIRENIRVTHEQDVGRMSAGKTEYQGKHIHLADGHIVPQSRALVCLKSGGARSGRDCPEDDVISLAELLEEQPGSSQSRCGHQ